MATNETPNLNQKAAKLRDLHVPGDPVVLPNAWDAASAQIIAQAGFAALATSSAAISACLGWADGEAAPVEAMLTAADHIANAVAVPVTVDFERGYRLPPEELVERFVHTGAVGLNIEDSDPATGEMVDPDKQAEFISGIRAAAAAMGVDLVINARTDSFLRRPGTPSDQLRNSIDRGNRYLDCGADCIYPLGTGDPAVVATLIEKIDGPVNVALGPQAELTINDLAMLGVARVTFGPGLQRQLYARFQNEMLPRLTR